jgi:F-type H+-transporting ATPase subunit delta
MKVRKEALRAARLMLKASMPDGRVDGGKVSHIVGRVIAEKPRGYLAILEAFQRLLRLELLKTHAVIESAEALNDGERQRILHELGTKYGPALTHEFKQTPELLGGLRVKVGSTIWDGSLRRRLEALKQSFGV